MTEGFNTLSDLWAYPDANSNAGSGAMIKPALCTIGAGVRGRVRLQVWHRANGQGALVLVSACGFRRSPGSKVQQVDSKQAPSCCPAKLTVSTLDPMYALALLIHSNHVSRVAVKVSEHSKVPSTRSIKNSWSSTNSTFPINPKIGQVVHPSPFFLWPH